MGAGPIAMFEVIEPLPAGPRADQVALELGLLRREIIADTRRSDGESTSLFFIGHKLKPYWILILTGNRKRPLYRYPNRIDLVDARLTL